MLSNIWPKLYSIELNSEEFPIMLLVQINNELKLKPQILICSLWSSYHISSTRQVYMSSIAIHAVIMSHTLCIIYGARGCMVTMFCGFPKFTSFCFWNLAHVYLSISFFPLVFCDPFKFRHQQFHFNWLSAWVKRYSPPQSREILLQWKSIHCKNYVRKDTSDSF